MGHRCHVCNLEKAVWPEKSGLVLAHRGPTEGELRGKERQFSEVNVNHIMAAPRKLREVEVGFRNVEIDEGAFRALEEEGEAADRGRCAGAGKRSMG